MRIRHALFDQSRVIASTLIGAANPLLAGQHFHTLFIDEAAQALEAACWIPLLRADRAILAGDHQQLPPTIKSPEALKGGLGRTLMEQVAEAKPDVVRLLRVQYRMNEELMHFSSEWFYGGQLEAAPEVRHRSMVDDLGHPLEWIDTDLLPQMDEMSAHEQWWVRITDVSTRPKHYSRCNPYTTMWNEWGATASWKNE